MIPQNVAAQAPKGTQFTPIAVVALAVIFWVTSQNASGQVRHVINLLLLTLFMSMVLLNWSKISPIILKGGAS